jgi:hypothetical protein
MAFTDIARPDWKKTSSARAGVTAVIKTRTAVRISTRRIEVQL